MDKKLSVLMIPSGGIGLDGITSCIMNYYRNIDHRKVSFTFVVTKILGDINYFEEVKSQISINGDKVIKLNRESNPLKYIVELIKFIKKNEFDVIHIHGSSSIMSIELFAAKITGIPVRIVHSHNTRCNHNFINKLLKPFLINFSTVRLACGSEAGKWLYGNKDFEIIKNGIEVDKFKYNPVMGEKIKNELNLRDKKIVGHVGAFNNQKNQIFLIEILKELQKIDKSYHMVLVGDGDNRKSVEEKAKEEGVYENISFLGRRTDIADILNAIDVMVLPSLYEGLPLVAIEWQAAGLKCIVSDSVTEEIRLTNLVSFLSLNDSAVTWAQEVHKEIIYDRKSDEEYKKVCSSGYNIKENANELIRIYSQNIGS